MRLRKRAAPATGGDLWPAALAWCWYGYCLFRPRAGRKGGLVALPLSGHRRPLGGSVELMRVRVLSDFVRHPFEPLACEDEPPDLDDATAMEALSWCLAGAAQISTDELLGLRQARRCDGLGTIEAGTPAGLRDAFFEDVRLRPYRRGVAL